MTTYRLAKMVHGYPLQSAGSSPYNTFSTLETALEALGAHVDASGYAGTFNPVHPAATEWHLVARSTKDSALVLVTDTPED